MSTVNDVNKQVMDLWRKWANILLRKNKRLLIPLLYPQMKQDVILFIGMNPSFVPEAYKGILANTPYSDKDPNTFFDWSNQAKFDLGEYQAVEKVMRDK